MYMMQQRVFLSIMMCWLGICATSQDSTVTKRIAAHVYLDSVVITASRQGFSVEDFIQLVQKDESLYTAFRNLRTASYEFETSMSFWDRQEKIKASFQSSNKQISDGSCRQMEVIRENASGDFHKGRKQKHRYYTYELYDRVFLTHGIVCEEHRQAPGKDQDRSQPAMESQVGELKTLIFRPGEKSHIPLIGRKTEIFSEDMINCYDFSISSEEYNGKATYVFAAKEKDMYSDRENKTVFKELITYFSKDDFQVVARKYTLSQKTAAYLFDVTMKVELIEWQGQYFPKKVVYNGTWNIPTKKRESGTFTVHLSQFE